MHIPISAHLLNQQKAPIESKTPLKLPISSKYEATAHVATNETKI